MSNLDINDADFLKSLKSHKDLLRDGEHARNGIHQFREPKANTRKDKMRSIALSIEESQFQIIVDYAREKNCSVSGACKMLFKELINNQIKNQNGQA
jgi:hypothetical protein